VPPESALDLGAGGGVPGLVLAAHWPGTNWVLLDSDRRRAGFLDTAVLALGWAGRVRVLQARAEVAGHDPQLRGRFQLVCARSFARPAPTAECGAPFLTIGGYLVVSDPPSGGAERWPAAVSELGLSVEGSKTAGARSDRGKAAHFTVLRQDRLCPERYPRKPGVPVRRPLF
jgi:16S rRNA (guanine527-N7)-methyltransferase